MRIKVQICEQARRDGKQDRVEKSLKSQIQTVTENIVRRLEKSTFQGQKRIQPRFGLRDKSSAGSSPLYKSGESNTFEFLISVAAEVIAHFSV